jgi:hypothetical protein
MNTLTQISEVLIKAIMDGYNLALFFNGAYICCDSLPAISYHIATVSKYPSPCMILQGNIYRIILPDGVKGHAFVSWKQDNDE